MTTINHIFNKVRDYVSEFNAVPNYVILSHDNYTKVLYEGRWMINQDVDINKVSTPEGILKIALTREKDIIAVGRML